MIRLAVVAVVIEYLLIPQLAGSRKSWHLLLDADNAWLLAAVGLECGSLAAYGLLTWTLLPRPRRPSFGRVLRIDLSTLAVSHCVPAGSAVGIGLGYRLLVAAGVAGTDAVVAKATQAVGSALVLNALLGIALVATIALHGFTSIYGVVALVGLALLAMAAAAAIILTRHEQVASARLAALIGRLPFTSADDVRAAVGNAAAYLRHLGTDRRLLARVVTLAAANWLLDAAALWACVRAFGHTLGPDGLLVPYGIANVLAAIPLTPAGLGVVEAFLIPSLVGFNVTRGVAILGVLAWRALSFLLPIPVGLLAYLSLPSGPPKPVVDRGPRAP
ncbi:MAG: YbhN family protein [Actinomycetota bacterium]|nr:YbhN family protein [Actinomycetota bacterium]